MYNYSIIKNIWLKNKKILLIAFAIAFVVALFFVKNKTTFKNSLDSSSKSQENGLAYNSATLEDLVNKDTDGDGILDWEEGLYGLDPTKKETTPGVSDQNAISKLKAEQRANAKINENGENEDPENLTETDKFSRELFATIAAGNQNGMVDQTAIETLGTTLAERIKNPIVRKVFSLSDLKISNENNAQAFIALNYALNNILKKYPMNYALPDILQKFMADENNVNTSELEKLGPIIEQTNKIIDAMTKINVPRPISDPHLSVINPLERVVENISDIKFYDTDAIPAIGAINQYGKNSTDLGLASNMLTEAIKQKLNN